MNQRLAEMASRDGLTGVYNRRYYQSRLDKEVDLAKQGGRALGLLVFHINDFKQCNDTHGYECGDRVLVDLAAFLRKGVRTEDLIARYGEAEFLVMLTGGASQEEAQIVADKLMSQVASQSFGGLPASEVVISCGIAWMPPEKLDREAISRLADEALEQTKQKAGACIVLAGH
jgi:diguanylate cyclase (GGDEF)-like protein